MINGIFVVERDRNGGQVISMDMREVEVQKVISVVAFWWAELDE